MSRIIIALDGQAASGKSTLARELALLVTKRNPFNTLPSWPGLPFSFLSTGLLYRTAAYCATQAQAQLGAGQPHAEEAIAILKSKALTIQNDAEGRCLIFLDQENITEKLSAEEISTLTSQLAQDKQLREYLIDLQRHAFHPAPCVIEGRDIGRVIFPQAQIKFFVSINNPRVAAERRAHQLFHPDLPPAEEISKLEKSIFERNARDAENTRRADGAIEIDNSGSLTETLEKMYALAVAAISKHLADSR